MSLTNRNSTISFNQRDITRKDMTSITNRTSSFIQCRNNVLSDLVKRYNLIFEIEMLFEIETLMRESKDEVAKDYGFGNSKRYLQKFPYDKKVFKLNAKQ